MEKHTEQLKRLVEKTGKGAKEVIPLPPSGSPRKYFRIKTDDNKSFVGVFHPHKKENRAHYYFTKHFIGKKLPVPEIYAHSSDFHYFVLQDLGNTTLLKYIEDNREKLSDDDIVSLFKKAIDDLLLFQIEGIKGLNLEYAFPVAEFNKRSILWDLNYFKYSFVKSNELEFDENSLEDDFETFSALLLNTNLNYFHYRDFQSRNIMLFDDKYWYIDFQGGRKGPLEYDLVSLVFQAKAGLKQRQRKELYEYYLQKLSEMEPQAVESFKKHYPYYVFFRLIQVLGAYGFRGLFQRKPHFLESIYPAVSTLEEQLKNFDFPDSMPELKKVLYEIAGIKAKFRPTQFPDGKLLVEINSFSYKKNGIPYDISPNGGGFVFDCRALPNPGRLPELRNHTGKEKPVIEYLEKHDEIAFFKKSVFGIIDQSIQNYLERGFTRLQVNFGCTGGKHRSVYMAESLKKHLSGRDGIFTVINHKEQEGI